MDIDNNLAIAEAHVSTFSSSLARRPAIQFDISIPEDVARIRRDPSIQSAIAADLQKNEADLQYLERIQADTQRLIADVKNRSARIRAALAPVASCPPEILSDIFHILALDLLQENINKQATALIDISGVSRKWRNIALSTSSLWVACSTAWSPDQEATWLDRSAQNLIDVYYRPRPDIDDFEGAFGTILLAQSFRWRSFTYHPRHPSIFHHMTDLMNIENLLNLQSIDIASQPLWNRGAVHQHDARRFLSKLPSLTSIHFRAIGIFNADIIAANLIHLSLLDVTSTTKDRHTLLSVCKKLETLKLGDQPQQEGEEIQDMETIDLPKLRELSIEHASGPQLSQLLDVIHAPQLSRLALPFSPTVHFSKSHRAIEALYISARRPGVDGILVAFSATSSPTGTDEHVLPLMPNLQEIDIATDFLPFHAIKELIISRERSVSAGAKPLGILRIQGHSLSNEEEIWITGKVETCTLIRSPPLSMIPEPNVPGGLGNLWFGDDDDGGGWEDELALGGGGGGGDWDDGGEWDDGTDSDSEPGGIDGDELDFI